MAVPCAEAVELEQQRRQLAAQVERGQAGMRGAGGDQLRAADPGHGLLDAGIAQRLDADQRILAAADRDQRVFAQAQRRRRRIRRRCRRELDPAVQVQAVAIGELAESVEIDAVEEGRGSGIDGIRLDADGLRHRRLVVADARDQVQQAQRALRRSRARIVQDERRAGHADGFDQLRAIVEGIDQLRDAGLRIERAAHETERADRIALEHPLTHSSTSSAGSARRLYALDMQKP